MINNREYGIVFYKDSNCGIAKVTVFDSTIGKYIAEDGSEQSSPVSRLVDTYQTASPTYSYGESYYCYWIKLTVGHTYTITVVNNGTHNPLAIAPYNMNIANFLNTEPLVVDDLLPKQLVTQHEDYPTAQYIYTIDNNVTQDTFKTQTFSGDGVIRTFILSGNNHAAEFVQFSIDGGLTWRYPTDLYITWGGNVLHDDETMDANDQFGIYFIDEAPAAGVNNILLKFRPKVNQAVLTIETKQPHDISNSYKNYRNHIVLEDYALEFIP